MTTTHLDEKFAKWKGIDRTKIEWNPTINADLCIGCGICITSCGRNVFEYNSENKKAVVERPYQCMVGCTSCETWCTIEAISFPDKEYVREIIKKEGLMTKSRKELEQKYHG